MDSRLHFLTIRMSGEADREAIARLAQLEGRRAPEGEALIAEVEGEALAALPVDGGEPLADPFHPTASLVELLETRLRHLRGGRRRLRHRLAALFRRPSGDVSTAPLPPERAGSLIR